MNDKEKRARARRQRLQEVRWFEVAGVFMLLFLVFAIGVDRGNDDLVLLGVILLGAAFLALAVVLQALHEPEEKPAKRDVPAAPAVPVVPTAPAQPVLAAIPRELIASDILGGRFYQMIPGLDALHFVYLEWGDSRSAAATMRRVTPMWDDAALAAQYQKGFMIPWRDIAALEITMKDSTVLRWHATVGQLTIRTAEKTRRFFIVAEQDTDRDFTPSQLRGFFAPAAAVLTVESEIYERQQAEDRAAHREAEGQNDLLQRLIRPLWWVLPLVIDATLVLWMLLFEYRLLYDGFAWVMLVLGLLPFVLAVAAPKYFTVRSLLIPARFPRENKPAQCDLGLAVPAAAFSLMLRGGLNFTIADGALPRLVLILLVPSVVLTALMVRRIVLRRKPLYCVFIVLCSMLTLFGVTMELNYQFDTSPAQRVTVAVTEKRVIESRETRCQVKIAGQEAWIDVTRELYDDLDLGDPVIRIIHPGALGIPYTDVEFLPKEE